MAISEAERSDLHPGSQQGHRGRLRAETLMSGVPAHNLDQVANKADIAELRAEFKTDLRQLRPT